MFALPARCRSVDEAIGGKCHSVGESVHSNDDETENNAAQRPLVHSSTIEKCFQNTSANFEAQGLHGAFKNE